MIISSLRTSAYRNLTDAVVNTASKNIFLVGENGQGKTNFIESLYFCAFASSFRGSRDSEIACSGEKNFSASITVEDQASNGLNNEVLIKYENGKKSVLING